ncbi:YceD family protein [Staphylococcus sp. SQ8-PEA]|uniref:YceD family protein n=1 Tax=Staphylococcus marylandisciuri TaxID=2981529 RepID=A0ABT2QNZ4_9STAP|nr:YceD family protein [Staphylococcus marylandisciuri]MCU5745694.1 YceD family protein [Staphylococcus marylandisciuri]
MKWSITQLRKYQGKPFEIQEYVNFDQLKSSLDLIDLSSIYVEGEINVKSKEVIADIQIKGTYTMACARTLTPVEVPLNVTTQEIFELEPFEFDEDDEGEEHYHDVTDGMVNLKEVVREIVVVEKPMRAFSKQSDQMLREGNGWEVIDEDQALELEQQKEEETQQVDPRLQKLQHLYDNEK